MPERTRRFLPPGGLSRSTRCTKPSGIVRRLIFPRQIIEGRSVASCPVAILRNVEFLVLVISYAGTVLIAPAVTLSIDATRLHKDRIPCQASACYIVATVRILLRHAIYATCIKRRADALANLPSVARWFPQGMWPFGNETGHDYLQKIANRCGGFALVRSGHSSGWKPDAGAGHHLSYSAELLWIS